MCEINIGSNYKLIPNDNHGKTGANLVLFLLFSCRYCAGTMPWGNPGDRSVLNCGFWAIVHGQSLKAYSPCTQFNSFLCKVRRYQDVIKLQCFSRLVKPMAVKSLNVKAKSNPEFIKYAGVEY